MFILWAFAEIKPCIHSSGKLIVKFYNHISWRVDAISVKLKVETSENLIIYIYIYYKNSYHYNSTYFLFILRQGNVPDLPPVFKTFCFLSSDKHLESLHLANTLPLWQNTTDTSTHMFINSALMGEHRRHIKLNDYNHFT